MRNRMFIRCGALLLAAATCWATSDYRLIDAVKRRDAKAAAELIKQHADINAALPDGATALAWAVFLDLPDIATQLIDAGANVNTSGEYGETPLTLALANGDVPLVKRLLKAGADPKVTRWNSENALMIAANTGSAEEVALLLDAGLDINRAEEHKGQNALMWASAEVHPNVVDLLIQRGADINVASKSGFTALVFAAIKNDADSVKLLLKAGADPNYTVPGMDKAKVLGIASAYSSSDAAMALLDGGADPNVADRKGYTPLHIAAERGQLDLAKKLISKGANVNAFANKTGALSDGYFKPMAGGQTPLLLAARMNKIDIMRALIDAGADTTLKSEDGTTFLLAAANSGHVESARFAYQYDKNLTATDNLGYTAMHMTVNATLSLATQPEMVELVQYLADIGVPMDELTKGGRTPIRVGDGVPIDMPIQRMADIIISRGGTPKYMPKEYVRPTTGRFAVSSGPSANNITAAH
jgi:uncharacterized protein